jgi:ABC-2 type transport system ATP-binding protein
MTKATTILEEFKRPVDVNKAAIEATDLTKFYGSSRGVIDLNLSVQRGEIFGFLGPNGAGKTTTIRLFLSLITPSRGNIFLLERESKKGDKELLQKIGYLSGEMGLYHDLTGMEYLRHLMRLRGGNQKRISLRKMDSLIERFNINLHRKINGYSSGMKQMVAIIQAFMHDPILLILDEPTRGLDPLMQERFHDLLREEKSRGTTIFLSSHNLREVEKVCDRVGVIKEGRLIFVEEIAKYRAIVGKKISVVTKGQNTGVSEALNELGGVEDLNRRGAKVEFFYKGSMQRLIQHVAALEIEDLTCETPSLEDVFIRHYEI